MLQLLQLRGIKKEYATLKTEKSKLFDLSTVIFDVIFIVACIPSLRAHRCNDKISLYVTSKKIAATKAHVFNWFPVFKKSPLRLKVT